MNKSELDHNLQQYRDLVISGNYEEAAQLANKFLWELHAAGDEEGVKNILLNTLQSSKESMTLSSAWLDLGGILYNKDMYEKARVCYLHALAVLEPENIGIKAKIFYGIGNTYFMEGEYLHANEYYNESLRFCQQEGNGYGITENLCQLSEIARTLGRYDDAESFGKASLEKSIQSCNDKSVMRSTQCICNLAVHLEATGQLLKMEDLLRYCINLNKACSHTAAFDLVNNLMIKFKL